MVAEAQQGLAPKYLFELICKPLCPRSARPLSSADRFDLFVNGSRALSQHRAFTFVGRSLKELPFPRVWSRVFKEISIESLLARLRL